METLVKKIDNSSIELAAKLLNQGDLVAFPTETVYGLGADATNDRAVASIFEAKGRPQFNPLIAHIADISWIDGFAVMSKCAKKIAETFWPAPMTLVMNRSEKCPISLLVSAGLDTVAVRFPNHKVAQDMIKAFGKPVAAPSANISGTVSPTTAEHVYQGLNGRIPLILDNGPCKIGVESTVLDVRGDLPVLLRAGGLAVEEIEEKTGLKVLFPDKDPELPRSPGQLLSHYAPKLQVKLNVEEPIEGWAMLGFGKVKNATLNLSEKADVKEAATNLFAYMRLLDKECYKGICVSPIPNNDLGLAINDRLKRAAYPH
ncbi:MAG: threonylcarbamoyl-AMP synthase [Alphaproteobacteria bacterium]|nr:threonylcarbamoyl-AMP synthase [Alphaproteobacteria bacterium]